MMTFIEQFKAARKASVPLIGVRTPDPAATIESIVGTVNVNADGQPNGLVVMVWDLARGLQAATEQGKPVVMAISQGEEPGMLTNPVEMLNRAYKKMPEKSMLFLLNWHSGLTEPSFIQAVWNGRDQLKQSGATLVLLCPDVRLPIELAQDVMMLDEPLPTAEDLAEIVKETYTAAKLPEPEKSIVGKATDAIRGLMAFSAEQVCAVCLAKDKAGKWNLDMDSLWETKRRTLEQTPGLGVWRGKERFSMIGGLVNIKNYAMAVLKGRRKIGVILFMDEIEKMVAGAQGDLSGTSQEMLGTFLSWMQDKNVIGILLVGVPGTGKSLLAKACGNEVGVLTITYDISAMKGSLVGESGLNMRMANKVVDAVAADDTKFIIATCNSIKALPPELRRRFKAGTFYMDLPDAEEQEPMWLYFLKLYSRDGVDLAKMPRPNYKDWTGAEIEQCCELAWSLNKTLVEAAEYVTPVAVTSPEMVQKLRELANGRFISASKSGWYVAPNQNNPAVLVAAKLNIKGMN